MKKENLPFSGVLLVNKQAGISSHGLVSKMRWCLGTRAVGHAGTLDPMATGLMLVLVGAATKLSQWVITNRKAYTGEVTLGYETTTGDREGEPLSAPSVMSAFTKEEIQTQADALLGVQELEVPKFSAIKVDGKKLYKEARAGREVQCPTRSMIFYGAQVLKVQDSQVNFSLECSKGSYVRSWAVELGRLLKTGAHLSALSRTQIGDFNLSSAATVSFFEKLQPLEVQDKLDALYRASCYVPLLDVLPHTELVKICSPEEERLFVNGQIPASMKARLMPLSQMAFQAEQDQLVRVASQKGQLAGLVGLKASGKLKLERVFPEGH